MLLCDRLLNVMILVLQVSGEGGLLRRNLIDLLHASDLMSASVAFRWMLGQHSWKEQTSHLSSNEAVPEIFIHIPT